MQDPCSFFLVPCQFISAVPVQNMPTGNGPIAGPLVLLFAAFSRTAHPNAFTLDTAPPLVFSNTPSECEVDRMSGCRDNRRTDRQTSILVRCSAAHFQLVK